MRRPPTRSQINSQIRKYNRELQREVDRVNAHNQRVVNNYNRQVKAHNARVRSNRAKLQRELNRLNSRPATTTIYVTTRASTQVLQRSFERIEYADQIGSWESDDELFEMLEGETANSVSLLNVLEEGPVAGVEVDPYLRQTSLTIELQELNEDLDHRWRGALYALSPDNPDAARHFCTSSREILVEILNQYAPKGVVLAWDPSIELTEYGQIPRRDQIRYCLVQSNQYNDLLSEFVDQDINSVMNVFGEFNPATHGAAGRYDLVYLGAMKIRVEGAIQLLHRVVTG